MKFTIYVETTTEFDPTKVVNKLEAALASGIVAFDMAAKAQKDQYTSAFLNQILKNGVVIERVDD